MIDCPDLTVAPYYLASSGLSGSQTIVEVGGPPFLLPLVDRTKIYNIVELAHKVLPNAQSVFLCGAGAGPHPLISSNCEVFFLFRPKKKSLFKLTSIRIFFYTFHIIVY